MSKARFYRELEANLPANNISHAGKVFFTNERNIYVYDASGARQKMTEVIFMATEAAITAIGSPLPNKVYVAIAEATMWFWRTSNSTWQKLGGTAVANLEDLLNVTITSPANGQVLTWNGTAWVNSTLAAGSGDVVGPASVTADRTAIFNGTTGKLIKQGAYTEDGLRARANHTGTQDASTITGTKTNTFISDFAATVRSTVLTGLSTATNAVVAAADTVLVAIGKLQAQFTALKANVLEKDNTTSFTPTANFHPATKKYVDDSVGSGGGGDMLKSVYDIDNDGVVEDSKQLNAQPGTHYLNRANHTGTQVASTISDLNTAVAATPAVAANTAKVTNATHTGDVTGATALTIANNAVTNAKAADMATARIKGRVTASTGDPEDLTAAQVRTLLNVADGATANDTDANLKNRANHTGTQVASTISDFAATVRSTVLTGLSTATNAVVAAADTVLVAIGKLQAQFTALKANVLEKNNTTAFTPTADYHPATKKYIDDIAISAGSGDVNGPAGVTNERISVFDGTTGKLLKQGAYTEATIRDRANHTGTQVASTISDLNSAVAATPAVAANTAKTSNATHTGDVTGATALTIANDAVTNAKAANMAVNTIKGRISAGTGDPEDLTAANVRTIINVANGATANDTDANLKNRANHTGTQVASTISDFAATVRGTVLTGLSYASMGIITATDTVLSALGNLQSQISESLQLILQLNDEKQGNIVDFVVISGSTVTLSDTLHAGKHLRFTNTGAIEITINTGIPNGFQCVLHKEHDSNTISFGGTATYIATSPTITEEEATVSVLVKNGKVKLIGQYN